MTFPKIGNLAPAITLLDQKGKKVSLKDFRDKKTVVLYFYPKAMTPGCTLQAKGIRDHIAEFKKKKIEVLAVSPDSSERLLRFQDRDDLNFKLLSDPENIGANKYGVWGPKKFMGKEYVGLLRTTFIIGKDGKLKYIMDKVKTKTHHEDVLKIISEL